MGGIRKFRQRHRPPPKDGGGWHVDNRGQASSYKDIVKESKLFEDYYRAQAICDDEPEFQQMMEVLKTCLPSSFRVTGFRSQAVAVRNLIESKYFKELAEVQVSESVDQEEGKEPSKKIEPKCLSWYPDRMAWQLNLTRKDIRREEVYFKLHNFLISETESGNISRQETVSMIPPLVLDVQPHHKVLDMCAAPGSKTAQLIEAIHADEVNLPTGLVVANDSDNSRCYMLVHQAKRLQSPNVIITNHDASIMPNIQISAADGSGAKVNLKYDRILCDVPCTGDGTLRKNADIWPKWNAANGCNLHGIQYRIAKRGLELLEIGGMMVYSTCSLNPLEDEAVVNRLLIASGGSVELLDVSTLVPGLKYKPGLSKWLVASKDNTLYTKWEEVPKVYQTLIRPGMFSAENDDFNLDRCMRVLPHQQDTGGFFVAVLQKNGPCLWENKKQYEEKPNSETATTGENQEAKEIASNGSGNGSAVHSDRKRRNRDESDPEKKRARFHGYREDPFVYFESDTEDPIFTEIREYFDLKELNHRMFFTRCRDNTKRNNLYFSSLLVRDILETNLDRVKIVNTGVKAFAKCENKGSTCAFRLAQEGSLMTIPFLGSKIVKPTLRDLELLLQCDDTEAPPQLNMMDAQTLYQLEPLLCGCIALLYEGKNPDGHDLKLELVGWKGKNSVRAYVPKQERIHYLRLIGADTSKYEKNKFEVRRENERKEVVKEESPAAATEDEPLAKLETNEMTT